MQQNPLSNMGAVDFTKKVYLTTVTPSGTDQYYTNVVLANAKCVIAVVSGNYAVLYPDHMTTVTMHNIALGVSKTNYLDYTRDYLVAFDKATTKVRYVMPFKGGSVDAQNIDIYYVPN